MDTCSQNSWSVGGSLEPIDLFGPKVEVMKPTNDKTLKEKDPTLQINYLNTISDSFLLA